MAIKYASEIIKEIVQRGPIEIPEGCVTGEEFERWLMNMENSKKFERPELPFLLIYADKDDVVSYSWHKTEKDLRDVVKEVESYGDYVILYAMEISAARDIELNKI